MQASSSRSLTSATGTSRILTGRRVVSRVSGRILSGDLLICTVGILIPSVFQLGISSNSLGLGLLRGGRILNRFPNSLIRLNNWGRSAFD